MSMNVEGISCRPKGKKDVLLGCGRKAKGSKLG